MSAHSPAPWTAYRMVHEKTGVPMSPEQIGEYVCNSVKKSAGESGTLDFLIVQVEKEDGSVDVCHVGNGPTSPANACLIAAAPEMLDVLKSCHEYLAGILSPCEKGCDCLIHTTAALIAKAEGSAVRTCVEGGQ